VGKTVSDDPAAYHPAVYHMLDAGMVARALLAEDAPGRWRPVLAASLGLDEAAVAVAVPWLVALHDLGKCSQAFQHMAPQQEERLRAAGVPFGRRQSHPAAPDRERAALRADPLVRALPEELLRLLIEVVGGPPRPLVASRPGAPGGQTAPGLRAALLCGVTGGSRCLAL
jgi:hypothetical protein